MMNYEIVSKPAHKYFIFSSGTSLKAKSFETRLEAEIYMRNYCKKHNLIIECTECDRHERKYSTHKGARFYINRI